LNDTKPNLLVRRSSGEPLDQERRQVVNVLVPKHSNGLRLPATRIPKTPRFSLMTMPLRTRAIQDTGNILQIMSGNPT